MISSEGDYKFCTIFDPTEYYDKILYHYLVSSEKCLAMGKTLNICTLQTVQHGTSVKAMHLIMRSVVRK